MMVQLQIEVDPRTLAHAHGPGTSHAAARANAAGKATNRLHVLVAFAYAGAPASTAELHDLGVAGVDLTELRRRATDLTQLGYLRRLDVTDGRRRPGHRLAITDAGWTFLAAHGVQP